MGINIKVGTYGLNLLRNNKPIPSKFYELDDTSKEALIISNKADLYAPIITPMEFAGGTYIDTQGDEVKFPDTELEAVLMSVSRKKRIQETAIVGREGTIKEYISASDYSISIKGVITGNTPTSYPFFEVQTLIDICNANTVLQLKDGGYLSLFDVSQIVVKSFTFTQRSGNYQLFEIEAVSDTPVELLIDEDE